jgi:predicted enzyme related to lactoylglutathione lyase
VTDLPTFDAIAIDCADPDGLARFWAAVLGTEIEGTAGEGHYVDLRSGAGLPTLRFQRVPELKVAKNRLHLDLTADDPEAAAARIAKLGGRRTSEAHAEYGLEWIVMEDPEGNEFCVISH